MVTDDDLARAILALVEARGTSSSICPSEAARAVAEGDTWRSLMGRTRQVAARLSNEGRIDILRKGKPIPPAEMHGVVRLRLR